MHHNLSILFYVKRSKPTPDGLIPIYLRVTIEGKRVEISTKKYVELSKWNAQAGKMTGNSEQAKTINGYLDILKTQIYQIQKELLLEGLPINADTLRAKLQGKEEKQKGIIEVYEYHNHQFEALVGKQYAVGTHKIYKTSYNSLKEFLKWKYKKVDYPIKDLNHQFITEYEFYLKSVGNLCHNTAMVRVKKLKKIIGQCVSNEWLEKNPFANYKITTQETHRTYLLEDELNTIAAKEFLIPRLDQARDIFLFSCYTGLAYSDVEKLTPIDISTGIDGNKWIFTQRTKTGTDSRIPLLPLALGIIQKYIDNPLTNNSGKLLPVYCNQRMNSYLKEIADVCGIHKELTFHCARHTFATTVTLTNGVPIESVAKMLGHKNLRTTQIYAKVIDRKVSDDMQLLKLKFQQTEKTISAAKETSNAIAI